MPRPPTPVGTWGVINAKQISSNPETWEAHARFRMADGSSKPVRRRGKSKTKAINNLKERLSELANEITSGEISKDTRFARICDLWLEDFREKQRLEGKSPTTAETYERQIRNWIKPALGELQAREVRARGCDRLIKKAQGKSYATAASVRSVLSSVCNYAVRFGAMDFNPVKSLEQLSRGPQKEIQAMTLEQRDELLAKLEALGRSKTHDKQNRSLGERVKPWRQMPNLVRAMLATGVRLGELLALDPTDVEAEVGAVWVRHHIVRVTGEGLLRLEGRKGGAADLLLGVPQWSLPMWRELAAEAGDGPLFASWNGQWQDPRNTRRRIREALDECGFGWVTPHVWRKTVAMVLDEAGLSTNEIADQLGNTPDVVERHYRPKRKANPASAAALEAMFTAE
ncbi:tyrosine-type recombinase/integrase [Amycolatopsis thermoflava]|uniref:tyrosine-type recombinase/integrase n=1 Tax=Amycolatopsis thermoflava TaxID=84480 RepID=UPI003F49EA76